MAEPSDEGARAADAWAAAAWAADYSGFLAEEETARNELLEKRLRALAPADFIEPAVA